MTQGGKTDGDLGLNEEDAVFIIGAGHFGARAARILSGRSNAPVIVVDSKREALRNLKGLRTTAIHQDGIRFLVENIHLMRDATTLVPALPLHLAYEWLAHSLPPNVEAKRLPLPETDNPLPNAFKAREGSTLVSYADFFCPDDCPEPVHCTVTGEKREKPLFALLREIRLPPFRVHIIRSHQLAPGLGGYRAKDLREMAEKVTAEAAGKWVLGTACKCHGILTAFELGPLSNSPTAATGMDSVSR